MFSNSAKEVHSMHGSIILALPIAVMLVVPSTHAAGLDSKERAAKKACLNGDSAKGVSILTDLYVDTNDATYIFNQGRCLEQNSRYKDAIARFREYLRKAGDQTEAERAAVQKHIDDCESLLKKEGVAGPAAEPPNQPQSVATPLVPSMQSSPAAPALQADSVAAASPAPAVSASVPTPADIPGSGLRTAGIVSAAIGSAALIVGVVLNLKANSMVDDLTPNYDKGVYSSSKTYKTLSMVSYGTGAACVAGSVILYYLGWETGRQAQIAVIPSFATGSASAVLTGAF